MSSWVVQVAWRGVRSRAGVLSLGEGRNSWDAAQTVWGNHGWVRVGETLLLLLMLVHTMLLVLIGSWESCWRCCCTRAHMILFYVRTHRSACQPTTRTPTILTKKLHQKTNKTTVNGCSKNLNSKWHNLHESTQFRCWKELICRYTRKWQSYKYGKLFLSYPQTMYEITR